MLALLKGTPNIRKRDNQFNSIFIYIYIYRNKSKRGERDTRQGETRLG